MTLIRLALVLLFVGVATFGHAQDRKTFPTDAEINLVLTQADRAIQQYKPLIDQQEAQLGKNMTEAVVNDRQVVHALETALKAFKTKPGRFNGPLGFAFFVWLDDADRNALLCSTGASSQSARFMIAGNTDKAEALLHLSQSCMDLSTLIYTVSENADALYTRYVEAEEQLAMEGATVAERCTDILKKSSPDPKK
jgi:hypothetical protein